MSEQIRLVPRAPRGSEGYAVLSCGMVDVVLSHDMLARLVGHIDANFTVDEEHALKHAISVVTQEAEQGKSGDERFTKTEFERVSLKEQVKEWMPPAGFKPMVEENIRLSALCSEQRSSNNELKKENLDWRKLLDAVRTAHHLKTEECKRLKTVYAELQVAHLKLMQSNRPPFGSVGDSKDGSPPSAIVMPTVSPPMAGTAPHVTGIYPMPVSTELKSSGPAEYAVIHADKIDALAAAVNRKIQEGWKPTGGICAENFDAVFKPQPATRYYQAITS